MKTDLMLLKRIHDSISTRTTGSPETFAKKLGISLRSFHENREFMVNELAAPIMYSRAHKTYYYTDDWELYIGDLYHIKAKLIKGVMETINNTIKIMVLISALFG